MSNGKSTSAPKLTPSRLKEIITEQQRTNRRANRHSSGEASYGDVDPSKLLLAISNVTRAGCAIQFGYTKDGSAFVIRIVGDGEPYNEFVRPSEDINLYFQGLAQDFDK